MIRHSSRQQVQCLTLLSLQRQALSLVRWSTRRCFRRRAQGPVHGLTCLKFQPHRRRRCTRQSVSVGDIGWMFWGRRAQMLRFLKVVLLLLQQLFRMKTTSLQLCSHFAAMHSGRKGCWLLMCYEAHGEHSKCSIRGRYRARRLGLTAWDVVTWSVEAFSLALLAVACCLFCVQSICLVHCC